MPKRTKSKEFFRAMFCFLDLLISLKYLKEVTKKLPQEEKIKKMLKNTCGIALFSPKNATDNIKP